VEISKKLLALLFSLQMTGGLWRRRKLLSPILRYGQRGEPDPLQKRTRNNRCDECKSGHDQTNAAAKAQHVF
jgi:hypothetical protein